MAIGYPAAYRNGAVPRASGLSKARPLGNIPFPSRLPAVPPYPANNNFVFKRFAKQVIPRLLPRLIPGIGWALTGYEIWKWANARPVTYSPVGFNYVTTQECFGGVVARTHYKLGANQLGQPQCCVQPDIGWTTAPPASWFNGTSNVREGAHTPTISAPNNWAQHGYWRANAVGPYGLATVPARAPTYDPVYVPEVPAWANPGALPIHKPVPTPKPKPFHRALPAPGQQPSQQPEPWHRPGVTNPMPIVFPLPAFPFPVTLPPLRPVPTPGGAVNPWVPGPVPLPPNVTLTPGQPPRTSPPGSRREPPGRRVKEKKLNIRNVVNPLVHVALNFATEGMDFVEAMWEAIPKELRTQPGHDRKVSTKDKFADVWEHLDQINLGEAVEKFVNNQFEDFISALGSKQVAKVSQGANITTGLDRSTRIGSDYQMEAGGSAPKLPELDYDPETGEWWLTGPGFDPVRLSKGSGHQGYSGDYF